MLGGTYGELKAEYGGRLKEMGKEIHHIPPWDSTWEPEDDGLAILMDYDDHRALTSTGNSESAQCWRNELWIMWDEGRKEEAIHLGMAEVQNCHDDKYDDALRQMLDRAERDRPADPPGETQ